LHVHGRRRVADGTRGAQHLRLHLRAGRSGHARRPCDQRRFLLADRQPHQSGRGIAVAEHANQIDDRPVRRLVGLGDDLQQRAQDAAAKRRARFVRGRVAVHRRQQSLEQRCQQLTPRWRVLPHRDRVGELHLELGQAPAQVGELQRQPSRFGDRLVVMRRAHQATQRVRRLLFVASPDEQPRQGERRGRVRVVRDRGAVRRDRLVIGAGARLQIADPRERLRIGGGRGSGRVRKRARDVVARERDVAICRCASRARPGASFAISSSRATASSSWPVRFRSWTSANPASTATSRVAALGAALFARVSTSFSVAIALFESPIRCCASARKSATSRSSG
jgi:hypothetical protein